MHIQVRGRQVKVGQGGAQGGWVGEGCRDKQPRQGEQKVRAPGGGSVAGPWEEEPRPRAQVPWGALK